ncbi:hypothetical protein [Gemmatimonas sp.]|uniref:hypothetical protein n=1 Tax=Gemmatimonas sp. TaxID=1962908 RepID=UPI0022BB83EF|nr:hypothetical protein [Gemmatimonas sp.]MCZ8206472.1 hypothetical protein [Gemmatimonas sp.]
MQHKPVITADALSPDWMGAAARPLPDRVRSAGQTVSGSSHHDTPVAAPTTSMWRSALRWVRDAAIGLAIITSIPLVVIATRGDVLRLNDSDLSTRIAQVEKLRVLRLPTTSELSPLAAGHLWHATDVTAKHGMFPVHPAAEPAERGWQHASLSDAMFADIGRRDAHLLQSSEVLRAAQGALSASEQQYLRTVAESPIWGDIDRLASAGAVDVIGARYVLPFRADATPVLMPIPRFATTKEIAYAGLSRAAYHLSQGEPERAEHALRSVLSYGFVMLDNGTSAIEGLIGRVMVGIASEGLHTLYTITGNAAGAALTAPITDATSLTLGARDGTTEQRLIAVAGDPTVPRTIRLESLRALAFSSCTNVRGTLLGPSAASDAAFDEARRTLARYPSEVALIELMQDAANRPPGGSEIAAKRDWLLLGAASVASTVLNNPRIQTCTRVLGAYR